MKVLLRELTESENALSNLAQADLPARLSFTLALVLRAVRPHLEAKRAARQYVSEVIRFLSALGIVRHLSHDNHMLLVKAIPMLDKVMLQLQDYRRNVFERNRRKYAAYLDATLKQNESTNQGNVG